MCAFSLKRRREPDPELTAKPPRPGGVPEVAVLTLARDEGRMMRRWVDHYAGQVGLANLVVFDDSSSDGSTDDLGCTVHRIQMPGGNAFEHARMELLSNVAAGLLSAYDVVVLADVDEFLVADPAKHANLPAYLAARADQPVIAPLTLNVLHHPGVEGPIDPDAPVLGQRRYAKFSALMCKPAVKRVPASWSQASHGILAPFVVDPELFMVHLKFYDRDWLAEVAGRRQQMVVADGRAKKSSWSKSAEEMTTIMASFLVDAPSDAAGLAAVPEFDPDAVDLAPLVTKEDNGLYRTIRQGQIQAMRANPLVRVPERLHGLV